MIKAAGAIMILVCSICVGYRETVKLKKHSLNLKCIRSALFRMRSELALYPISLPDLTDRLINSCDDPLRNFACNLKDGLPLLGTNSFSEIWIKAAESVNLGLRGDEAQVFKELGSSLGRYEVDEQIAAIKYAETRFDEFITRAESKQNRESRLRVSYAVAAGAFVIMILY